MDWWPVQGELHLSANVHWDWLKSFVDPQKISCIDDGWMDKIYHKITEVANICKFILSFLKTTPLLQNAATHVVYSLVSILTLFMIIL